MIKAILISILLLTLTISVATAEMSDYVGTYKSISGLPFNSAMIFDPASQQWYSIVINDSTTTVSHSFIDPDVYLFPSQSTINTIYNIVADGKITFQEKIILSWEWYFMPKSWNHK